jgi:UDP-galactopyranose mutase
VYRSFTPADAACLDLDIPLHRQDPKRLLLCLSHLRWDFVRQRPHHLLSRAAQRYAVLYVEEPHVRPGVHPHWELAHRDRVMLATPILPESLARPARNAMLAVLLDRLLDGEQPAVAWFYTPLALEFARHLHADVTVYDNMDELALFHGADSRIALLETELLARADLVFTGGLGLWEAKRHRHHNIHAVPSSVDAAHFARALGPLAEPADLAGMPRPRVGFFGVIDERMDMPLVADLASRRPDLAFVMLGPTTKIDRQHRPTAPNLHWVGGRDYHALPAWLAHWDCGFMPFAINAATRFISPTKTPEYLAAGLPLVSTPIRDVVRPWGELGLVGIGRTAAELSTAIDAALARRHDPDWRGAVAARLAATSWDRTWAFIAQELDAVLAQGRGARACTTG